jgi:hypothetical protein
MREEEELANVERHLGERLAEARTHWAALGGPASSL